MRDLTNSNADNARSSRFAKPVTSPELGKAAQGVIPSNTEASTLWAVRTFNAWAINRSFVNASEAVPVNTGILNQYHSSGFLCITYPDFCNHVFRLCLHSPKIKAKI